MCPMSLFFWFLLWDEVLRTREFAGKRGKDCRGEAEKRWLSLRPFCVCVLRGLSCDLPLYGYLAFFSACSCACMLMAFITALPAFSIFAARLPVT